MRVTGRGSDAAASGHGLGYAAATLDATWREVVATNLDTAFWVAQAVGRRWPSAEIAHSATGGSPSPP
jgi:NAD(P)-dependent dehydrogenase (short-subunit alcohol dehydrogenase family)